MAFERGGQSRLAQRAGCSAAEVLDFSANINPLGPPRSLRGVVCRTLDAVAHYPDADCDELVETLAAVEGVPPERIVVGNGSTEIIHALARAASRDDASRSRAVIPVPSYSDYADASRLAGMEMETIRLDESGGFALDWAQLAEHLRGDEVVFLARPNNPTGTLFHTAEFIPFAAEHPNTLFVVDEAFLDFVEGAESLAKQAATNVVVSRSLTEFHAIPGLRLGMAVAPADLAASIREQIPRWSVNTLAQAVGIAAIGDDQYAEQTRRFVARAREQLHESLSAIEELHVYPGCANYLLVKLNTTDVDAPQLAERLLQQRIAIRVCDNFEGLDRRFFRVAVRENAENEHLVETLRNVLSGSSTKKPHKTKKRTAALMMQGTSSNAGKSVLAAAMCRILRQDGVRVAPFKSQNMSLNSFVTADGLEMGRAQVVQAEACCLEPDVRMNPVLLKPTSDTGCQVIVEGLPVGNMRFGRYIEYKPRAFEAAKRCYDSLADEFDAVVLEGAGSPAEVNLKHHDIVNMQMARYADAPVLLAGDIDRGGLFASFVGTLELLTPWERRLVQGLIVNRFSGDASMLGPAIDHVKQHTGKPTLGIVPYVPELGLPEEDSVEFKAGSSDQSPSEDDVIDIAVVDLPHISNFTDIDALRIEKDVRVRVVRTADELGEPDAVILPGSKSVLSDMRHVRRRGFAEKLSDLSASDQTHIVGICGGFQMLGRTIADPLQVESRSGSVEGLGLLQVATALAAEKTLAQAEAIHAPSGLKVTGYEIHHGQTEVDGEREIFEANGTSSLGVASQDGNVWGTYLHGVFDADAFRRWFIDRLRVRRGMPPLDAVSATYDIDPALDRLARIVRENIDIDDIYRRMGL